MCSIVQLLFSSRKHVYQQLQFWFIGSGVWWCRTVEDSHQILVCPTSHQSHLLLVFVDTVAMYHNVVSLLSAVTVTDAECRRLLFDRPTTVSGLVSLLAVDYQGDLSGLQLCSVFAVKKQSADNVVVVECKWWFFVFNPSPSDSGPLFEILNRIE